MKPRVVFWIVTLTVATGAAWFLLVYGVGDLMRRTENRNFEKIRKRSELDCRTMPYHCAVRDNNLAAFSQLKANGQDVNATDRWGRTAVLYAYHQNPDAILPLVKLGADLNRPDDGGDVPLSLALRNRHFERADELIRLGADPNAKIGADPKKLTHLTYAVVHKDAEAAAFLVKAGADLARKDDFGYTACERAAVQGTTAMFPFCK
jgi:ankyrin repeat protein